MNNIVNKIYAVRLMTNFDAFFAKFGWLLSAITQRNLGEKKRNSALGQLAAPGPPLQPDCPKNAQWAAFTNGILKRTVNERKRNAQFANLTPAPPLFLLALW